MVGGNFPTLVEYLDTLEKLVAAYREVCHHSDKRDVQEVNAAAYYYLGDGTHWGYKKVHDAMEGGEIPIEKEWHKWLIQ